MSSKGEAKANLATGKPFPFTSFISQLQHKCFFTQNRDSWIIDTRATDHMCMSHLDLSNKQKLRHPVLVKLATNQSIKAYHTGNFFLNNTITLANILQFDAFDVNLISVARLTHDLN